MSEFSAVVRLMTDILAKASRYLARDYYELQSLQSSRRSVNAFVDRSVQKVEKVIFNELERVRPNFGVRSSSFNKQSSEENGARWLVNIIDGKDNFAHAMPFFGLSIAIEEKIGNEDIVTSAVISFPILDEVYFAERGKGAWYTGTVGQYTGTLRLRASQRTKKDEYLAADVGSGSSLRLLGSDLLSCAYVASGRLEAAKIKDCPYYDIASAFLLIREAGGSVSSESYVSNGVFDK